VLYAFCRVADDAVDRSGVAPGATARLAARLEAAYAGAPEPGPVDRALATLARDLAIPRMLFEALLEGLRWDEEGRRYETLPDLLSYCVRVAATVGVMMTLAMGDRRAHVLARACDLGVAMQLTNIARDVGEDARAGRLYLPGGWMREAGLDPGAWLARPAPGPALASVVRRVLAAADALYARADPGIFMLPRDCRMAIRAARLLYADIGRALAAAGYDSVTRRAATGRARKAWLLACAAPAWLSRHPATGHAPPLDAAQFLIDAVVGSP
jgi:phytoene synthase